MLLIHASGADRRRCACLALAAAAAAATQMRRHSAASVSAPLGQTGRRHKRIQFVAAAAAFLSESVGTSARQRRCHVFFSESTSNNSLIISSCRIY